MKLFKIILNLFDGSTTPDTTNSSGMSVEMKTYYDKQLLTNAEPLLFTTSSQTRDLFRRETAKQLSSAALPLCPRL